MRINSICFKNFRNIHFAQLHPAEGINIIYGDNAQGKTNILEGIYLMSGERSFRYGRESDMVRLDLDRTLEQSLIECKFYAYSREQEIRYQLAPKKQVLVNGVSLQGQSSLAGRVYCTVFSPTHLSLIKDGPNRRREFIDDAICQIKPQYERVLSDYGRALSQRSVLLKDIRQHASLIDTLDVWDSHIIRLGRIIINTRSSYVRKLAVYAQQFHDGISSGKENLQVSYQSAAVADFDGDIAQQLAQSLAASRAEDIRTGLNNIGPHRDDLEIKIGDVSARSYGSQGQQRSAVLSLKLAECEMIADSCDEQPIVLLDDVMSELDFNRRAYLLGKMGGRQVFITGCDRSILDENTAGRSFYVENGSVTQSPQSEDNP